MSILNEISLALQKGNRKSVTELVNKALSEGILATDILDNGLLAGMNEIGEKFKNNEVYVPEVLISARAMKAGVEIIKPLLIEGGVQAKGKVCIGTVQGDLHDIGKNLVKMMLEGKGLNVIDLGVDVSAETFVEKAKEAGIRDQVKIMIGGAPVSQEFCDKIGADCYTVDAASAADAAVEFCK